MKLSFLIFDYIIQYPKTLANENGHYMFVNNGPGNFYEPAVFKSPQLPDSSDDCEINFFYSM